MISGVGEHEKISLSVHVNSISLLRTTLNVKSNKLGMLQNPLALRVTAKYYLTFLD